MLTERLDLKTGKERTLEFVGKDFNGTKERISKIEAKALRKLRHSSRPKKPKPFLGEYWDFGLEVKK